MLWSIFVVRGTKIVKFITLPLPWCHRRGQTYPKRDKFSTKNLLNFHSCGEKTKCIIIKIHKALYQNCEIDCPWFRCSCPRVELIWPCSKSVLNILLYSSTYLRKTKSIVIIARRPFTYIVKFITPGTWCGQYVHIGKNYQIFFSHINKN